MDREPSFKQKYPCARLILLCVAFAICTWSIFVVNKNLVSHTNTPALIAASQMLMTLIGTYILSPGRIVGTREAIIKWLPVPMVYFAMLVSLCYTYKYLKLSVIILYRSVGPVITLPIAWLIAPVDKRPPVSTQMVMALILGLTSVVLYCHTIKFELEGTAWTISYLVLTLVDRAVQRRLLTTALQEGKAEALSTECCIMLNNGLGLLPTVVLAVFLREFDSFDTSIWLATDTTALLILSGLMSSIHLHLARAVQSEIRVMPYMILQKAVWLAVVTTGVLAFNDPIGWPFQLIGMVLSFWSTLWYGRSQIAAIDQSRRDSRSELAAAKKPLLG